MNILKYKVKKNNIYEVTLENGSAWYNGNSIVSDRDYIIRGGLERGMFYYGDISMSSVENATRSVLISK